MTVKTTKHHSIALVLLVLIPAAANAQFTRIGGGLNIGTGIEMIVADDINAFTQVKYVVSKYQHLVISIGVHYYISGRRYKTW